VQKNPDYEMLEEHISSSIGKHPDKLNIFIRKMVKNYSYNPFIWFWQRSRLSESGSTEVYCTLYWKNMGIAESINTLTAGVGYMPRAQLLGQSISLKFSLKTRLESKSFEPLSNFLAFLVQKLWSKINKLTLWEPGYDIFVLWNRPKTSSCQLPYQHHSSYANSARELFKGSNGSTSLLVCTWKKFFVWGLRMFCELRHKWSSFGVILNHVTWPRAQLLGQSISLKFALETRLESESFEPLIDFLAFLVHKLSSKMNKLVNYLINKFVK